MNSPLISKNLRLLLTLVVWMLLPFVWMYIGLQVMSDFRAALFIYGAFGCLLPVLIYKREHPLAFWPLNMNPYRLLAMIVLTHVVLMLLWWFVAPYMLDWPNLKTKLEVLNLGPAWFLWSYVIYFIIANPILEECFWRGIVYRHLQRVFPMRQSILISAFFFGAWHWSAVQYVTTPAWGVICTMIVMLGGIIFALTYERTKTLSAPILIHSLGVDLPIVFMLHQAAEQVF